MRISKIILDNFRGYKHVEIDFNRFNCIVGKNDVGKSTIFVALDWFFGNRELNDIDINIDSIEIEEHSGCVVSKELSVEVHFETSNHRIVPPFFFDENKHSYYGDFVDENKIFRVRKYLYHSNSYIFDFDDTNVKKVGYQVWTNYFKNNKILSDLTEKQLIEEGNKIGVNYDNLKQDIYTKILVKKQEVADELSNIIYQIDTLQVDDVAFDLLCEKISSFYQKYKTQNWEDISNYFLDYQYFPKFIIYNSYTPINDYLRLLFGGSDVIKAQTEINEVKKQIAKDISLQSSVLSKKEEFRFSDSYEYLADSVLLSKNGIPLSHRGEGFQLSIKNAVFVMLTKKENVYRRPIIFAFEEPETHLHPSAQIKMYDTIKSLSEKSLYQVVITTHSPFIVSHCDTNDIKQIKIENNNLLVKPDCLDKVDKSFLQEVIEDLGIGPNDDWLSIYDTYKSILFVEGKNDIYTLRTISEKYKTSGKVSETFDKMGCLMIPVGGCSSVEEWAKFGIVTKLSKPFLMLLDSDKKSKDMDSENQSKLTSIYNTIEASIDGNIKTNIKLDKHNFVVTKKRELENYIKPDVIEKYFNKRVNVNMPEWKYNDIMEIYTNLNDKDLVEFSITAFVYDNEYQKKVVPLINALPDDKDKGKFANKIRQENPIDKKIIIDNITEYKKKYKKSLFNKEDIFREWVYCLEKGIDIDEYDTYRSMGLRTFMYCKENKIDIDEYTKIANKCSWVDKYYLITYLLKRKRINADISKFNSKEDFENALDEQSKKKMAQSEKVEQSIIDTTIPSNINTFHFSDEIKNNWSYIDVPLAVYCSREHKDYDEDLPNKKSKCQNIKDDINKHFFEEGNIKFEDLDFSYGDNQDEFLDIYNRIRAFNE